MISFDKDQTPDHHRRCRLQIKIAILFASSVHRTPTHHQRASVFPPVRPRTSARQEADHLDCYCDCLLRSHVQLVLPERAAQAVPPKTTDSSDHRLAGSPKLLASGETVTEDRPTVIATKIYSTSCSLRLYSTRWT
jgi:hypothetical protein